MSAARSVLLACRNGSRLTATDFLLALDQHGDARGNAAAGGPPGAQRFQEHHRLALVVDRAARDEALAVRTVDQLRLERRAVPQLQRIDRLHVVVPVEQHVRPLVVGRAGKMPDDHGMPGGRTNRGFEAQAGQLIAPPLGRLLAIRCVRRLRADRRDAQQIEQRFAGRRQVGIDMVQDGGNGRLIGGSHQSLPAGGRITSLTELQNLASPELSSPRREWRLVPLTTRQ